MVEIKRNWTEFDGLKMGRWGSEIGGLPNKKYTWHRAQLSPHF